MFRMLKLGFWDCGGGDIGVVGGFVLSGEDLEVMVFFWGF